MKRVVSYLGCFLIVAASTAGCSDDESGTTETTAGPTTATGGAGGAGGSGTGGNGTGGVGGTGGGTSASCVGFPEGAQSFEVGGETHCYWLVTTPTPQIGANDACTHGGHLATIASAGENAHVAAVAGGSTVWIGLRCDALPPASCTTDPSQYEWMTGEPFGYQNWAANEPAIPRGVAMQDDESWYGHDALQNVFPYVCEAVVGG